jgi:hypothetical protein
MLGHMVDRRHIAHLSSHFALWIDGTERVISRRNVKEAIVDLQNVTTDSLHEQAGFLRYHCPLPIAGIFPALIVRILTLDPKLGHFRL